MLLYTRARAFRVELAEIANTVKPGLLELYHRSNPGGAPESQDTADTLIEEIQQRSKGKVVVGHDLDVF